jgi:class 3 adenylate cyclase/tetratricopeptide (TPR) repeat protein
VSVLFVDLVGYTGLAESRDAEDVRELLSRYFDTARTIVGRYGGVVEKFIGDAVMAVWGSPQAREDDAERAVRAALELVDAVAAFGEEVGAAELRARAGIVTGQVAAVSAPGEAMVVGDRVNTASRVQSVAEPGSVYVDDTTRQATSAAIAYADAGEHTVKGKQDPLHLWRAERVVAGVAGARGDGSLEGPFVGRDSELRLIKELFHAGVERRSARLVSVTGPPGVGKSRLRRELENYVDGLAGEVLWHSGRCLSYGEGVAYFALAEMVRQRLGIPEDEAPEEAARKLGLGLERWITDAAERDFLEPRLGALIGVASPGLDRQELFAGWRLFFERLSDELPVALSFEDLHWADDGLIDFIDHLLEWSADRPIFMIGFARPELTERRAGWPAGRRGATPLYLEPLSGDAVAELLDSLVSGLPAEARGRIVSQAEGIPLYALETVRALADRGALASGNGKLRPAGELGDLDVPATLSSLLAARLDALAPDERELVKAMAVFGGSFPRSAAAALSGLGEEQLDEALASLVRKQVLAVRADPLSPDRGQYAFAQTLLRTVAYEMLPKSERRPRHLAAADHLRAAFPNDGEEVAEVIASHVLDAYRAAAGDPDEDELRALALEALRRAARRTAEIGAPEAAARSYLLARELASSVEERTELTEAAGEMALFSGQLEHAVELLRTAIAEHEAAGREREAARLAAPLTKALTRADDIRSAVECAREAIDKLGEGTLDADVASISVELGTALALSGRYDEAIEPLERGLVAAQALELPLLLCRALNANSLVYLHTGRFDEALGGWELAASLAERHGLGGEQVRAMSNGGILQIARDIPGAVERLEAAIGIGRRTGDKLFEVIATGNLMRSHLFTGRWAEVERLGAEVLGSETPEEADVHALLATLRAWQGRPAAEHLQALADWHSSDDLEKRFIARSAAGAVALAEGRYDDVLAAGPPAVREGLEVLGPSSETIRHLWPDTVEAALATGRLDIVAEMVELLAAKPRGWVAPYLRAELHRAKGLLLAAQDSHERVEAELGAGIEALRELRYPYPLGRALLDLAAWLGSRGRAAEAAAAIEEGVAVLEPLGPSRALARASELRAAGAPALA